MLVFTAVPSSVVADTIPYDPKIVDIHGHSHPYVEAGGPYQNTSGRTIFFLGYVCPGSSGYPTVYEWKFGDGESYRGNFSSHDKLSGIEDPTLPEVDVYPNQPVYLECPAKHIYEEDGYYVATLTVWDNHGNRAFDTALVCINRDIPDIPNDYPQWKPPSWWQGFCEEGRFSEVVKEPYGIRAGPRLRPLFFVPKALSPDRSAQILPLQGRASQPPVRPRPSREVPSPPGWHSPSPLSPSSARTPPRRAGV